MLHFRRCCVKNGASGLCCRPTAGLGRSGHHQDALPLPESQKRNKQDGRERNRCGNFDIIVGPKSTSLPSFLAPHTRRRVMGPSKSSCYPGACNSNPVLCPISDTHISDFGFDSRLRPPAVHDGGGTPAEFNAPAGALPESDIRGSISYMIVPV